MGVLPNASRDENTRTQESFRSNLNDISKTIATIEMSSEILDKIVFDIEL